MNSRHGGTPDEHQLQEELRIFERQLRRFGNDGDCAYERALSKAYELLVDQRIRQLAELRAAGL